MRILSKIVNFFINIIMCILFLNFQIIYEVFLSILILKCPIIIKKQYASIFEL